MDRSTVEDRLHWAHIDGLYREAARRKRQWVIVSKQPTGWAVLLLGPGEDGAPDRESFMRISTGATREDAEYLADVAGRMIGDIIRVSRSDASTPK